ncbi:Eisosome component PIL1-domain-containing protein [Cristinia sonorae]|uniref:Eisosome component PIL1-domain-containing protein n=1 Tax=Cristinia sonorae TaxID=1940300 RepID=A0A8K0USY5_9AGAR|nr:Eisosome component PIL1-domain-containing protein [Cristinia sonorae]
MSSFFSSLADKAQSALKDTPLAQHIPGATPASSTSSGRPSSDATSGGSRTLDHLAHQFRTFQQQYSSSTTPLQKIITTEKGIAIDFDNVARDTQAHSKELYLWGQAEGEDLKDVSDRLGWLSYVQGTLAQTLANKLDAARAPYKELRAAEAKLTPHRTSRTNFENQIKKLETDNQRGKEQKIADLRAQIVKLDNEFRDVIAELEITKRKAFKQSEQLKWEAIREYSEKMVLISQAAMTILPVLPSIPPTKLQPYTGSETTTNVRAALQTALDSYKPGADRLLLPQATPSDLKRSDTRSFGQTHAKELDNIGTTNPAHPTIPITPPHNPTALPPPSSFSPPVHVSDPAHQSADRPSPVSGRASSPPANKQSPPLDPATLNQAPAPIPVAPEEPAKLSPVIAPNPDDSSVKIPSVLPTVAETGVPQSAGPDGPGPASGSLLTIKSDHDAHREAGSPQTTTPHVPVTAAPPAAHSDQKWESAEEEKKRLEREERERILQGEILASQAAPPPSGPQADGEELPAYKEF